MSGYHSPWAVLGIPETDDERAVKRAYSARLKEMDVEADPQGFIALRQAFEHARNLAIWRTEQKAEEERRKAEGQTDNELDQDWDDENWDDEWGGGPPPAAYAHDHKPTAAHTDRQTDRHISEHQKIDGVDVDLSLSGDALLVSPFAPPGLADAGLSLSDNIVSTVGGTSDAEPDTTDYYAPAFQGLGNAIALDLTHKGDAADKIGQPLGLPTQPLPQIFPDHTPLYASFFGYGAGSKSSASDGPALNAFADLEEGDSDAASPLADADGSNVSSSDTSDTPAWPPAIDLDTSGYVSFTRDDWGNADRERIAQLLYDKYFGPAEASDIERLATRLFTSPHMEEIDYRDWMENWVANLIAETSPRSDGILGLASQTFGWGTDADKLYHNYAVSRCVARNRDLDAIRQMEDPSNRWHGLYTMLQQPAPASISWWSKRQWQEVQTFVDNVRANRPTVEWNLDTQHVALWDKLIDARRSGYSESGASTGLQWYHYLIFGFMILQFIVRGFGGFESSAETDLPLYQQEAGASGEKPEIVDYTDLARIEGDSVAQEQRKHLARPFNLKARDPDNGLYLSAAKLEPTFDLSRYIPTADLEAVANDKCDRDCKIRVSRRLDEVAAGTTQVGDMSVKPKAPSAPKSLSDAELKRLAAAMRRGDNSALPNSLTRDDWAKLNRLATDEGAKNLAAPPPAPPAPMPKTKTVKVPLQWSFKPDQPDSPPTVELNDGMKKLGFTAFDIDALSKTMVRKDLPDGKFEWECTAKCDAFIQKVIDR